MCVSKNTSFNQKPDTYLQDVLTVVQLQQFSVEEVAML